MLNRRNPCVGVGILLALGACSTDGSSGSNDMVPRVDTIRAEVATRIGLDETNPAAVFGDISTLAVDATGRTYVADRIGSTVRVYDENGALLQTLASEGEGPGELRWPADVVLGPEGALWIRDAYRITVLLPRTLGDLPDSLTQTIKISNSVNAPTRSGVASNGDYFYPIGTGYVRVSDSRFTDDTVFVPQSTNQSRTKTAFVRLGPRDGRMLEGLSAAPFAPVPVSAVTDRGTVLSSDGTSYLIVETNKLGDTLGSFGFPAESVRSVPSAEHSDSTRAVEARIDSLPVPLEEVRNVDPLLLSGSIPGMLPGVLAIHVADDGRIWIQRWHPEGQGETRYYDVFDPTGERLCVVEIPAPMLASPPPYFGKSYVAGVVVEPGTGVEFAVTLRVSDLSACLPVGR